MSACLLRLLLSLPVPFLLSTVPINDNLTTARPNYQPVTVNNNTAPPKTEVAVYKIRHAIDTCVPWRCRPALNSAG
ncbi:MAG: hypothetical protein Kow0077_24850 [Anaerolineae bacterium]